jgi:serine protease Do
LQLATGRSKGHKWLCHILAFITVLGLVGAPAIANDAAAVPQAFSKPSPASLADLRAMEKHVESLIKKISPTVVALEIRNGSGSGVLISSNGFVLTAGHVVEAPNLEVRVTFPDGTVVHGKTVGLISDIDAGLVKITDAGVWPYAQFEPEKEPSTGDWILAMGHPGGFDAKRSLVTRLGRIIYPDLHVVQGDAAIQTDCTISPGDSGGPVFDMHGRVIAIHTFIRTSMSENYHVPVSAFADDLKRLMKVSKTASTK